MRKALLLFAAFLLVSTIATANNYYVTTASDTGTGSLRAAIDSVNNNPGTDTVFVSLSAHDTIHVGSAMAAVTSNLVITGNPCQNPTISGDSNSFNHPVLYSTQANVSFTLNYLNIINCVNHNSNAAGGAVSAKQLNLNYCHFYGNTVLPNATVTGSQGGAVAAQYLWAYNCTFDSNAAPITTLTVNGLGGAIVVSQYAHLFNCTFYANYSSGYGGAVYANRLDVFNCTFTGNAAALGGGALDVDTAAISNSIIWGNTTTIDTAVVINFLSSPDINVTSGGCNVLQDSTTGAYFTASLSDIIGDPLFGTFGYYSGCVPVIPFFCGSPAKDHASCTGATSTDAEGVTAHGTRDAGAFEITPAYLGGDTIDSIQHGQTADLYNYFNTTGLTMRFYGNFTDSTQVDTGTYTAIGTNFLGCSDTATVIIRYAIDTATSIKDISAPASVKIFPNPANDIALVEWNKQITGALQLQLRDITGRLLLNEDINATSQNYRLNTSTFSSGVYYIRLSSSDGKVFTGKLNIIRN